MAYGDGTLLQRKSGPRKGEWIKRYRGADGRWHATSWKSKPTRAMVTERLTELSRSSPRPPGDTLGEFLDRWLRDGTSHLRARTARGYRTLVDGSIGPSLGGYDLRTLATPDVQRWVNTGASAHALAVLRAALSEAVRWGLIPSNPARGVRLPKRERRTPTVLTPEQARKLLEQVRDDPLEALYVVAVYTGMRQGEVLGLRWQDVSLTKATLTVSASLWWMPDPNAPKGAKNTRRPVLTEPKTERSRRRITLAEPVVEALRKHQRRQRFTAKDGLVFTQPDGTALQPWAVYDALRAHEKAAGVPLTTFHALRHSAATSLIAAGVPVPLVSDMLGHSTVNTTLSIYRHVVEENASVTADAMAALLGESVSETVSG